MEIDIDHVAMPVGDMERSVEFYQRASRIYQDLGEEVSREVQIRGSVLTFSRNGMTFRGRLRRDDDCFCFKRIR